MVDGGEALQHAELGCQHRVVAADAGEVVAQQVDDHHVLGPVLLGRQQLGGEAGVLLGRGPARARALDRPGLDPAAFELEEALGRGGDDGGLAIVEEGRERGGVATAQAAVEGEGVEAVREVGAEALADVGLEDVAGQDVLDRAGDRGLVVGAGEVGRDRVRRP